LPVVRLPNLAAATDWKNVSNETRRIVSQLLVSCQQKSACQDRAQLGGVLPKRTDSETERGFWERWRPAGEWVVVRQHAGGTSAFALKLWRDKPGSQEAKEWRHWQRTWTRPVCFASGV
jgi:hypothetical protein